MSTLISNYNQNFAEQQAILQHLNNTLAPIVGAGPNQTGFSPAERAALTTGAIDTTGSNYANAARALANQTAGRNAGGNLPESGVDQQLKEELASKSAGQLSSEELGITESDYATGRANFNNAVAAEEGVAGQFNPTPTAGAATAANTAAFQEADTIDQQSNQEQADIAGGITSLAGAGLKFAGGYLNAPAGASSFGAGLTALAGG